MAERQQRPGGERQARPDALVRRDRRAGRERLARADRGAALLDERHAESRAHHQRERSGADDRRHDGGLEDDGAPVEVSVSPERVATGLRDDGEARAEREPRAPPRLEGEPEPSGDVATTARLHPQAVDSADVARAGREREPERGLLDRVPHRRRIASATHRQR
jgi:hypothetical protein